MANLALISHKPTEDVKLSGEASLKLNLPTLHGRSLSGLETASEIFFPQMLDTPLPEVNISSYPATRVAGLFFHSRAVIFKSGCFAQKYWSGTVTRKTVIQRADDY